MELSPWNLPESFQPFATLVICHMRQIEQVSPYSEMLNYKPLTLIFLKTALLFK
jgi:hypothetical protein